VENCTEEIQHSTNTEEISKSNSKQLQPLVSCDLNNSADEESVPDNHSVHPEYNCSSGESSAESESSINSTSTDSSSNSRKPRPLINP